MGPSSCLPYRYVASLQVYNAISMVKRRGVENAQLQDASRYDLLFSRVESYHQGMHLNLVGCLELARKGEHRWRYWYRQDASIAIYLLYRLQRWQWVDRRLAVHETEWSLRWIGVAPSSFAHEVWIELSSEFDRQHSWNAGLRKIDCDAVQLC